MNIRKLASLIIGVALLTAAVVIAAWPESAGEMAPPTARHEVRVEEVRLIDGARTVSFAGVTRSVNRASLSFAVAARLVSRPLEVGDRVSRGDVIATLDDREFVLAATAAEAALTELDVRLAQARRDLERVEALAEARAATAEEVEQVRSGAAALESARNAARARQAQTGRLRGEAVLAAPFDGTVTAVHLEPGEWAAPGMPVVELAGEGGVEVSVQVTESVRARLEHGVEVTVDLPHQRTSVGGRITGLSAASGGPGRLFPVEVTLDDRPWLMAGMTAEVRLPLQTTPSLVVPLEAVLNPGSSAPAVFRIMGDRAQRVEVRLGRLVGNGVGVEGDLEPGDLIVVTGHGSLADGVAVQQFRSEPEHGIASGGVL